MMDADKSYPIEQEYVAPIAPPILPPHQAQEMENQSCKLKTFFFSPLFISAQYFASSKTVTFHWLLCLLAVQRNIKDVILPLIK